MSSDEVDRESAALPVASWQCVENSGKGEPMPALLVGFSMAKMGLRRGGSYQYFILRSVWNGQIVDA